jgi:hypothetical protein
MCHAPNSSRDDVLFIDLLRGWGSGCAVVSHAGFGGKRAREREMTRDQKVEKGDWKRHEC